MARTRLSKPTRTFYRERIMVSIPRKPAGPINTSGHWSHCPAPTLSGKCSHSGYAQALHGCCPESSEHLKPGQTPVVTFDQLLFALAKQIQWKWPQEYGGEKFVVLFGGLHIEMAALKALGDWLQGSGWVQALV